MPETPKWYGGRDEEYLEFGPADTKEEILELARDDDLDHVLVGLYVKKEIPLSGYFDIHQWFENLVWDMDDEDGPDMDGENHQIEVVMSEDVNRLERMIKDTIEIWQKGLDYKILRFWMYEVEPSKYTATGLVKDDALL